MGRLLRIAAVILNLGLVAAISGCAHTTKSETAGQYVDDSVITSKVKGEIFREPGLKSLQINVKTYQGVVQLSGFVDSTDSARKAGDIARSVQGVREVRNDLVVK
ncbi:BON domain-containing protein [Geomesophilobacter sediminis]|uniref:BON domain-containing protein n=1 Tax=Geomesophilobacter sediminis TaxID=2798584 RepID=A0A8J7JGV7_9BACT|nr:BON domain-containing protein [Geomesophilobacter sediminis]MBJ6723735.1 BON domain-containing protein [Geomesophilobacter sediminis]